MFQQQFYDGEILMSETMVEEGVFGSVVEWSPDAAFRAGGVVQFVGVGAGFEGREHGGEFFGDGMARDGLPVEGEIFELPMGEIWWL
jgi:hypothetical protein